jgi:hypothetical protein
VEFSIKLIYIENAFAVGALHDLYPSEDGNYEGYHPKKRKVS